MNASTDKSSGETAKYGEDALAQVNQISILLGRLAGDMSSKRFEQAGEKLRLMRSTLLLLDPPAPGLALVVLASQHVVGGANGLFQNGDSVPERGWDAVSIESEMAISRINRALQSFDETEIYWGVSSLVFAFEGLLERINGLQKVWVENERIESSLARERLKILVRGAFESVELEQCLPAMRAGGLYLLAEQLFSAAWLTGSSHLRLASYLLTDISGGIGSSISETKWDEGNWKIYVRRLLDSIPRLSKGLAQEDMGAICSALDSLCLLAIQVRFRSILFL